MTPLGCFGLGTNSRIPTFLGQNAGSDTASNKLSIIDSLKETNDNRDKSWSALTSFRIIKCEGSVRIPLLTMYSEIVSHEVCGCKRVKQISRKLFVIR